MIERNLGYELATVLISSFCRDLLVNELPTLSHQPVSMAHCRGHRSEKSRRSYATHGILWLFNRKYLEPGMLIV